MADSSSEYGNQVGRHPGQGGGGNPGQGGGPKPVTIFVNGTPCQVEKERISYEELLLLIKAPPLPPEKRYSVQYSNGPKGKPTGTLIEGQSVEVKKDMEFDVTPANRS